MRERQIEAFRAVMTHGAVGRAAEVLGITQPAVSRLIADLERDVGFVLFERKGRGLRPTPEADLFKREVDTFFTGLDRIAGAAAEIRESRRGHVRLTVMPAVALSLAPRIVEAIAEAHPTARVTLDVHTAPRIADLVGAGQYDLGLAHLDVSRTEIEELGTWDAACVCVMPKQHPMAARDRITPEDLDRIPLVMLSFDTSTAQRLTQMFVAAGVQPDIRVEAQPSYAAFHLAARGLGVTVIDPMTARTLADDTVAVRPLYPRIDFRFKLLRPRGTRPSILADHAARIAETEIAAGLALA